MTESSPALRDPSLAPPIAAVVGWNELDIRAVDTARLLAADAVQKAGNGHPGTAMSLAPIAYLLYQNIMKHDPSEPKWRGRDRFVLSCGHSSLTQYIQLFLGGFGLKLDDLKQLRTWGSLTPGHPEVYHTPGVEITTGPLGSGLASAVGMAMAQRRQRGMFFPDTPVGESLLDHNIYVLASDGDIMEGVSAEASSLAGHQELGNLTVIYDENSISIEEDTNIAFSEDVAARYRAYGWDVREVNWRASADNGGRYVEDVDALYAAIQAGNEVTDKPTLVIVHTTIAWPAPTMQGTGASHGSALGEAEIRATKKLLGFDPDEDFIVETEVLAHTRKLLERGKTARKEWMQGAYAWRAANPKDKEQLFRMIDWALPEHIEQMVPDFSPKEGPMSTRKASGKVLTALAPHLPELWGGSADLAGSNNTTMAGEPSFIPKGKQTSTWAGGPYGRTLHFGIRENAMGMILNGMALESLTRPYGGTFLVFSDYMRPAVRLAALQGLPVTFVWTHDSIGVGEDGPTHQPIEHIPSLRLIPGLDVVRPADANETAQAWLQILRNNDRPAGLILSRQDLPIIPRSRYTPADETFRGGYILAEAHGDPEAIIIASGSEVSLALEARLELRKEGVDVRVVSMPCLEWFHEQDADYQNQVLPPRIKARVAVEAAHPATWEALVGDAGKVIGIDHFGASAPGSKLFAEFGFTVQNVIDSVLSSIQDAGRIGR